MLIFLAWSGDSSPGIENEVVEEVIFRSTVIRYSNTTAKKKIKTELSKKKDEKKQEENKPPQGLD